jgi:hypothetical protein
MPLSRCALATTLAYHATPTGRTMRRRVARALRSFGVRATLATDMAGLPSAMLGDRDRTLVDADQQGLPDWLVVAFVGLDTALCRDDESDGDRIVILGSTAAKLLGIN